MGKAHEIDWRFSPRETSKRTQGEVLRDIKFALATDADYGREARQQGCNPYDSRLGRTPRDIWTRRRP